MSVIPSTPLFRLSSVLLAALSLAIGWGIRGNFGHEYGAMLPGCLTAVAVCLFSGREDWRRRVAYFAMFGALGWGFGGSISYMQVVSYTHSGHLPSQIYGFAGLLWIGFLWAALGGAGTAFPAVADRERLTRFFRPLMWLFAFWTVRVFLEPWLETWWETNIWEQAVEADDSWQRHKSPFYWFDADWIQAWTALAAACAFDLWDRLRDKTMRWGLPGVLSLPLVGVLAGGGALVGFLTQKALGALGMASTIGATLTRSLGDTTLHPADNLMTNWPQFFEDIPHHLGWMGGLIVGLAVYFAFFGRFRDGSSLIAHMAVGWIVSFFIFPVILGIRMTPPRADDWAGITGVFVGMMIYMFRNGLKPVAYASLVCGFIGGVGFSGMQWLKLMMIAPGNPGMLTAHGLDPESAAFADKVALWQPWRDQNWHSFLEQSYGFVNGLAVVIAIGFIAWRVKPLNDPEHTPERPLPRRWTEAFAAFFAIVGVSFLNLQKNAFSWVEQLGWRHEVTLPDGTKETVVDQWAIPWLGRLPGLADMDLFKLTPVGWFGVMYLLLAVAFILIARQHLRKGVAIVPATGLGRGQLIYLVLLWAMVIGNVERALPAFTEGRVLTEGTIFFNAIVATVLLLTCPPNPVSPPGDPDPRYGLSFAKALAAGVALWATLLVFATGTVRAVYGDEHSGHAGKQYRLGENATWRTHPILKTEKHR
ncbi:MAG: hypothetical protein GY851_27370 [bacterium]|nr:hypothetical protein [bacterium]